MRWEQRYLIFSCGLFAGKNLSSCAERKQRHQLIAEALHQLHQDEFWDFWALIAFPFRYLAIVRVTGVYR